MVVTVTHDGYIKRLPPSTYRAQNRGGRGIAATNTREGDFLEYMFVALTHDYILFFTDHGKVYWLKVYDVPEGSRTSGGRAIVNLLQLAEGEKITGLVPVREFSEDEHLFMVTPPGDGQEDRAHRVQAAPRPRDHRAGPGRGRRADRRGADEGGRPGGPLDPRRHGDPVRRGGRPLDGPPRARRPGDRALRRTTRSIGMVVANGTTTRRAC